MQRVLSIGALFLFYIPAPAATVEDVQSYAESYTSDLPNFVCGYTDTFHLRLHPDFDWELDKWHTGEITFDGRRARRKVLTFKGKPTRKRIYQIAGYTGTFGHVLLGYKKDGYWDCHKTGSDEDGLDSFACRSDRAMGLGGKINADEVLVEFSPAAGTSVVHAESDTGKVRKLIEKIPDPKLGGAYNLSSHYGYVTVAGKNWLLPTLSRNYYDGRGSEYLHEVKYHDCKRFSSISKINLEGFE